MPPDVAEQDAVDRSLNQISAGIVRLAFVTVGALYVVFALTGPWLGAPPWQRALHVGAAVVTLSAAALQTRWGVSERAGHPWLLVLVVVLAGVNGIELVGVGDPTHGSYLMLTAFAAGYGFLSRPWFAAALGLVSASWLVALATVWPPSAEWRECTARVATAIVVSTAVFVTRRRSVVRQESLRRRAEERERATEAALAQAHDANDERLAMQQMMQEAQRRESLGVLAGGIAHDFNNLLAVIAGNVELARGELPERSALREWLGDAEAAADQAARLTRQMLAYAGRAEPRIARVELGRRVRDVARLLESSLPPGTQLRQRGSEVGPAVEADGAQLDQVLLNLLQNAVDACRDTGGAVEVDWGVEPLDETALEPMRFGGRIAPGRHAVFEVRDSGCGMDAPVQQRMFEPFFTTKPGGSGLGLAAAEGIAEAHGGALSVESVPGQGTVVRFVLPLAADSEKPAEPARVRSPDSRGVILVVDDQPEVRRVARRFLEREGFEVLEAGSGREGIGLARQVEPLRAALVDLTMPGQDGHAVAEALRACAPGLPIVIMSGFDRDEVMANRAGPLAFGFLAKPFSRGDLVRALHGAAVPESGPDAHVEPGADT